MATSPLDLAVGGASQLGRAFRIVGVLPGATLVLTIFVLLAGTGSGGRFDLGAAGEALSGITLTQLGLLTFAAVIAGLVLQPLQFVSVQFLEGYWGLGRFGGSARLARIDQYSSMRLNLIDQDDSLRERAEAATGRERLLLSAQADEAARLRARFPENPNRVMPTRLGNVLRRHEDLAGSQYGLEALVVIPHLALLAPKPHLDYLDDRRNELDAAVRFWLVWTLCAGAALVLLWPSGVWALVSLAPWALAWLSYRGAVEAASHYGTALSVLIDLNRFRLYDDLNVPCPPGTDAERRQNAMLMKLLQHQATVSVSYRGMSENELILPT